MSIAVEATISILETDASPVALIVPSGLRLWISLDDFDTLCRLNGDLRLERDAQGELIAMSPAGSKSGARNFKLARQLGTWSETDETGIGFDSSSGFTFPNGAVRAPDAAWIKLERWNALTEEEQERFAPIVPDFAAELCSPSDSRAEARVKMVEYIEQGVRLAWLIDPKIQEVEIYRPGRAVEILVKPRSVSGEDVLVGFILDLNEIFA